MQKFILETIGFLIGFTIAGFALVLLFVGIGYLVYSAIKEVIDKLRGE